jgi:hypothetical protein
MQDLEQQLLDTAWPFWECEAEIAKRFYAKASDDDHIFYLRAQLWKELNPVDGFFNGLHKELKGVVDLYPKVDNGIDRHDYHFMLLQLVQEFNHYVVLADIFEHLVGRPISPDDATQLDEEKKLGNVRRAYVAENDPLLNAAVGFTEGGGARLFREGKELQGSEVNKLTAKAMQTIFDDEHDHYMEQAKEAISHIKSPKDLERMKDAVGKISEQRVWMRAEMFRDAMSREEVETFISENRR